MKNTKNKFRKISKFILGSTLLFSSFSLISCKDDKEKLEDVIRQNEELSAQIISLNEQIQSVTNLYNEILALKVEMEESKNQDIDTLNAKVSELNSTITGLDALILNLQTQINEKTQIINSLNSEKSALSDEINQLTNQVNTLTLQINTLKSLKDEADKQIQDLKAKINELNKEIADLNEQIETFLSYTIIFDTKGGSSIKPLTIRKDDKIPKPTDPTRTGYQFTGWTCSTGEDWNFDLDTVTFDVTFEANWSPLTYTVAYDLAGGSYTGSPSATSSVTYDTTFTLPGVSKTDYTLYEWQCDGKAVSNGVWKIAKDATLKCIWAKNVSEITYKFNCEGMSDEKQTCQYGEAFTLKVPTRIGYTFKGWKYNGSFISSGTWKYLDDIVLECVWEANEYEFILNPGDGILDQTSFSVTYDAGFTLPVPEDLSDARPFAGWWLGTKRITNEKGESYENWTTTSGATLEAKFFHTISTVDDFLAIDQNPSAVFSLINDIDFGNVEVDSLQETFTGELWGMGFSLKNISFASDLEKVGLFAHIENAVFKDIHVLDSSIAFASDIEDLNYQIGLISSVATGECKFDNLTYSNIDIDVTNNSSKFTIGSLVGTAENLVVKNVVGSGVISGKSKGKSVSIGCLVGEVTGNITTDNFSNETNVVCDAYGGINQDNEIEYEGNAGGLVGVANNVTLSNTYNKGTVEGYSVKNESSYTGGLVGKLIGEQVIETSSNKGEVIATGVGGGLIGLVCQDLEFTGGINEGSLSDNNESGILGGLFGKCLGITGIFDSFNNNSVSSTNGIAGGLVGIATSTITFNESYNEGSVSSVNGKSGGILGLAEGEMFAIDSYNNGTVSGGALAGGIVAKTKEKTSVSGSYNVMTVESADGDAGGLVGETNETITISQCYNEGTVTGNKNVGGLIGVVGSNIICNGLLNKGLVTSNDTAGGLFGLLKSVVNLVGCYNEGSVNGKLISGGIVGFFDNELVMSNCRNKGQVQSENGIASGLVGKVSGASYVEYSLNEGSVSGAMLAAGIIGECEGISRINESYNCCSIVSDEGTAGGLIALSDTAIIKNCFNNSSVCGKEYAGGIIGIDNGSSIISYCFVSGNVGFILEDATNSYIGGVVGKANISSVSFVFVTANLTGSEGRVNRVLGEYASFNPNKAISLSTLTDFDDQVILEGEEQATIVSLETITANYLTNELYFDSAWQLDDVDLVNGKYPLLVYFVAEEEIE